MHMCRQRSFEKNQTEININTIFIYFAPWTFCKRIEKRLQKFSNPIFILAKPLHSDCLNVCLWEKEFCNRKEKRILPQKRKVNLRRKKKLCKEFIWYISILIHWNVYITIMRSQNVANYLFNSKINTFLKCSSS